MKLNGVLQEFEGSNGPSPNKTAAIEPVSYILGIDKIKPAINIENVICTKFIKHFINS